MRGIPLSAPGRNAAGRLITPVKKPAHKSQSTDTSGPCWSMPKMTVVADLLPLLQWAAEHARSGPWPAAQILRTVRQRIASAGGEVDYVEVLPGFAAMPVRS